MSTCYVCESGWIIVGELRAYNEKTVNLINASVVRSWGNGRGIGGIAKEEHKHEYTLDAIGNVRIMRSKVLFEIPCEW